MGGKESPFPVLLASRRPAHEMNHASGSELEMLENSLQQNARRPQVFGKGWRPRPVVTTSLGLVMPAPHHSGPSQPRENYIEIGLPGWSARWTAICGMLFR